MLARVQVGKVPMKFYFRAQDITVSMPDVDIAGKLVLVWKRGHRRTQSEPFPVREVLNNVDGSLSRTASTTQDLALICTMYKQKRGGSFESKSSSFSLREETPEGSERKLGTVAVDLSSYATPEKSSDAVELGFMDNKIRLKLTLSSHWLKQMSANDGSGDDSSVGSLDSVATAERDRDVAHLDGGPSGSGGSGYPAAAAAPAPAAAGAIDVSAGLAGASAGGGVGTTERERVEAAREARRGEAVDRHGGAQQQGGGGRAPARGARGATG